MKIRNTVKIPMVAIGGVNHGNVEKLRGTGVDGVAVISAVIGAKDITAAAEQMAGKLEGIKR